MTTIFENRVILMTEYEQLQYEQLEITQTPIPLTVYPESILFIENQQFEYPQIPISFLFNCETNYINAYKFKPFIEENNENCNENLFCYEKIDDIINEIGNKNSKKRKI